MIKAYLYDAEGEDREVALSEGLPDLGDRQLLWIDVAGRSSGEIADLRRLLGLDARTAFMLANAHRGGVLSNYGEYFEFGIQCFAIENMAAIEVPRVAPLQTLDFVVGRGWLLTVHEEPVFFLDEFRKQDRGETMIGNLTPASLAAALLDWHLAVFLEAMTRFEAFIDGLDVRMLAGKSIRDDLLGQVVAGRRFVSSLRRTLSPQRGVFYGLSRPDFMLVAKSDAASHFASLERRFERTIDTIEHGRDLVQGSFDLFTTRVAESTNVLVRRITIIGMILGVIGATAGIFGMNFDLPFGTGSAGFWSVLGALGLFSLAATLFSRYRGWV